MSRALRIFVNYRREDTGGDMVAIRDRLIAHFGSENVFLDLLSLQSGEEWPQEVRAHLDSCRVVLVLIGPDWMKLLDARKGSAAQDQVRVEIRYAQELGERVALLPVLVRGAKAPSRELLPKSLWSLAETHAERLDLQTFDADFARLITRIEEVATAPDPDPDPDSPDDPPPPRDPRPPRPTAFLAPPDESHYEMVLELMAEYGRVVPVLGTRISPSFSGGLRPPSLDDEELAQHMAREFNITTPPADLPAIAQNIYTGLGQPALSRGLKGALTSSGAPGPVHGFLARFARWLHASGRARCHQLIITTGYDVALERALLAKPRVPYDVVMYLASGPDKGKFVHISYEDQHPTVIEEPNTYVGLPIDDDGDLARTVVVRIHGAIHGAIDDIDGAAYSWRNNYVVTEDHFIDYLSRSSAEALVPMQILDKLRDSHCLFLGYPVRDWHFRVFLKRIWDGELAATSWAIDQDADLLDRKHWERCNVELKTCELSDYVAELEARLPRRREPPELAA